MSDSETMKTSRVLIVGSGGIGTMVGFNLCAGEQASVVAVLRSNYDVVKSKGFTIDSCDHGRHVGWKPNHIASSIAELAVNGDTLAPFDYIICTIKNVPGVPPTLSDLIRPVVNPGHSVLILIQNGLNIEKPLQKAFPDNICLSGVSYMSAWEHEPGQIVQNDTDRLVISPFISPLIDEHEQVQAALDFQSLYKASGRVQCDYEPNAAFIRWRKLLYNAVWNPVCALTNLDTTRLRICFNGQDESSPVNIMVRPAIKEVCAAAKAVAGLDLPESIVEDVINADPLEIYCAPSMLQDRRKGKIWEYENLLGEALREGEKFGVYMPTLRCLYGLCKAIHWQIMNSNVPTALTIVAESAVP